MEDGQELLEEGWQAHDLRSGVAKVYAEAKRRSTLGIRVAATWAVLMLIYGSLDIVQAMAVAPPLWEFGAGLGVVLLAALSMSRAPVPLLAAAAVVLIDLVVVAYQIPSLLENGNAGDFIGTSIRIILAPIVVTLVLNGYFGSLSIQAFKLGFSPGADWRTRINPAMMQLVVFGSCAAALVVGVASWFGAIGSGFAQTNVLWSTYNPLTSVEMQTARPKTDVQEAETDGKTPDPFLDIKVLKPGENDAEGDNAEPEYPETAKPITSMDGLDAFTARAVEEAFEFGAKSDEQGCVLEAHGRQGRCRDDRCKYWARVFLRACLTKSRKTEHYCDEIPGPTKEEPGLLWAQRMCAGRIFEDCRENLYAVQGHCHPPTQDQLKTAEEKAAEVKAAAKAAAARSKAAQ